MSWLTSVAAHATVVAALLWLHTETPLPQAEPSEILVNVVEAPESEQPGEAAEQGHADDLQAAAQAASPPPAATEPDVVPEPEPAVEPEPEPEPEPVPEPVVAPVPPPKPVPKPARKPVQVAEAAPVPDFSDLLSASQLIGAVNADGETVGGGSSTAGGDGGGGCNTARVLQQALRRDPMVSSAVANAGRSGMAVMLWNGDWVRSAAQDGKGLSGVRQAILWELAFAPEACRNKQVHGLVLLSLKDGTRFAIGVGNWRWSDLLGLRYSPADR